jgi:hypothetical protein
MTKTKTKWNRWRFYTKADDFRPLVFNPSYPWWCSGQGMDGSHTIVAFLPLGEELEKYWDDAFDVSVKECDEVTFTDRFTRPKYYVELVEEG